MQKTLEQLDTFLANALGILEVLYSFIIEVVYSFTVVLLSLFAFIMLRAAKRAIDHNLKLRKQRNETQRKNGRA